MKTLVKITKRNKFVIFNNIFFVKKRGYELREMTAEDKLIMTAWKEIDGWEEIEAESAENALIKWHIKWDKQRESSRIHSAMVKKENEEKRINLFTSLNQGRPITSNLVNLKIVMDFLNTQNWGWWNLPKMTIGYAAHQYDCDGKIATTFKLDQPINGNTLFKVGGKRGHLNKYTSL